MSKKKRLLWLALSLGIFVVFALSILIALSYFLNLNFVKAKLSQQLEARYHIATQIGSISLHVFPWPSVVLKDTKIAIKDFQAYLPYVSAYPKLGSLLHHRLEIKSVTLTRPSVKIFLSSHGKTTRNRPVTEQLKRVVKKLSALSLAADVKINNASIEIVKEDTPFLKADAFNLRASIQARQVLFACAFRAPFSDEVTLKGRANLDSGLEGQARFKNLKLERLPVSFLRQRIGPTQIGLSLTFDFTTLEEFYLGFDMRFPCFRTKSPALLLECGLIQGTFFRKKGHLELNLSRLQLNKPLVNGHGELVIDPHEISYNFEAQELDIAAVRKVALSVFPQHRTVKRIFQIVKGGKAQNFKLSQKAKHLHGLKHLKSITIEAQASNAKINIPEVGLRISNGQGHIFIKDGMLYGNGISGVVEGAQVKDGSITLDLSNLHHGTLNIKTHFTAPLKVGLFFLQKFVKSNSVQKELKLISTSKGTVSGQIAIKRSLSKAIDVSLHGTLTGGEISYQRMPYPAFIDKVSFSYHQKNINFQGLKGHLGHSLIDKAAGKVDFSTPLICLDIKAFSGRLIAQELAPWFKKQRFLRSLYRTFDLPQGELEVISARFRYKFGLPTSLNYLFHFKLKKGLLSLSFLPDKVHIEKGECLISPAIIKFQNVKGALGEDDFFISGEVKAPFAKKRQIILQGKGKVTALLQDWCYKIGRLPAALKIKTPAQVKVFRLNYTPAGTHLEMTLLTPQGIGLELNFDYTPTVLFVRKFYLTNNRRECLISFRLNRQKRFLNNFTFKGILSGRDLNAIFLKNEYLTGKIAGEINGQIDLMQVGTSHLSGHLLIEGVKNIAGMEGLVIDRAQLMASGKVITFSRINLYWQRNMVRAQGKMQFSPDALVIKGRVFSPFVNWDAFSKLLSTKNKGQSPAFKIKAEIDAKVDAFQYDKFKFEGLEAFIHLKNWQTVKINLRKARYCGLDLKGSIKKTSGQLEYNVVFQAKNKDLDGLYYCLTKKRRLFKATYVLTGTLKARGHKKPLQENSSGTLTFHSEKGRIYKFTLLAKIFSFLNAFEILKGRLPDLSKKGLFYKHFDISAHLKNGLLKIDSAVIDSPAMKIFGQGEIDICQKKIKMTVLVAPLRTLDILLSKIPVLGKALVGKSKTFVSIPLEVKGELQTPEVIPLAPTAVGQGLFGLMKRVLGIPVEIIKLLTPEKK